MRTEIQPTPAVHTAREGIILPKTIQAKQLGMIPRKPNLINRLARKPISIITIITITKSISPHSKQPTHIINQVHLRIQHRINMLQRKQIPLPKRHDIRIIISEHVLLPG